MKQLVEKHSTLEERKQLELETKQREKNQQLNSDKEDEMVCDTYKVYIDKLDESLTKKDKEIIDINITMNENKKEMDRFKNQLIELEKAHQQLLQGDNNTREITTQSDPSLLKEKVAHIKNLELSLGDAMDKIKSYETNQSSLMEQNKKLTKELEEAKEEAKKLSIEVEDAKRKRSETVKTIEEGEREGTTVDVNKESELSQEILVYQQKLKAANEEIQELLTTINEQKEMIESMNNELNQLRSNLERVNSENYNNQEILNNQIINLSQKLNNAKIENQNQKRTISELEQAAARISASNINAAAEEQFPMENQTIQQLKSKIEFLQNRIEALQNEKKSEEEASKNNIETAKARIAAMESLMIAYRNKIAESNKKALAAETQIQEQNQEIDRLYNEIDIAHCQLQSIERQVGRAMPSGVARRQGNGENSQEPLSGQYTIFANETLNSQTKPYPLNEETLIGKSQAYDKTVVNPELTTEENKNFDNSVDIMSSDTNVMIMKNNQLETDPLIRDCMNIFSTLDNMSLNFTPDFMIEKDADIENSVLNGSIIIDHPSYDNKYGVVSSSKNHEEINLEEENGKNVNENKENEKEEVTNSNTNEVTEGINKIEEIPAITEQNEIVVITTEEGNSKESKVEDEKEGIKQSDSIKIQNTNEEKINESESASEVSSSEEIIKTYSENRKSTLQPIAENELLTDTTLRISKQDDITNISTIDPSSESTHKIKKNRSILSVFGKRNKKSKKTYQKAESIISENSSGSNISQSTISGKKKKKGSSIKSFIITKS